MAAKTSPLKRAIQAARESMSPRRYGTAARPFECRYCGHDRFKTGQAILLGMSTLVCAACDHVEFFAKAPEPLET